MDDTAHTWVVGVDGSDNSIVALRWAVARAASSASSGYPVKLLVVAAWNVSVLAGVELDEMHAAVHQRATRILESIDHQGVPIDLVITQRDAAEALIDSAQGSEMLVVGSRGRSGLAELVLGSVSRQVATHARIPTVIVPEHASLDAIRKVVVGYDGSDNAEAALAWVCGHIDRYGEQPLVEVVFAFELGAHGDADLIRNRYPEIVEASRADFERAMAERDLGGRLTGHFVAGNVRSALVDSAAEAQLLVLGARGHGVIGAALLGSVVTWTLHHVQCALVVVPS